MNKYYNTTKRLWLLLKPFHKDFYTQLILTFVLQGVNLLAVIVFSKLLDSITSYNINNSILIISGWFVLKMFFILISYFSDIQSQNKLDFMIQQHLEEYSFKKIFKLNPSQFQEDHSAIKLQVINRGESAIENIVNSFVLSIIPTVLQMLFAFLAIIFYSKVIALWVLMTIVIVLFWSNKFIKYHKPFVKNDMDNWDMQRKVRSETFQHLYLIKIFGVVDNYISKYLENRKSFIEYKKYTWNKNIKHANKRWAFFTFSRFINNIIIIFLAFNKFLTIGNVYLLWSWINDIYDSIMNLVRNMRQLPLRYIELDKYLDIIDREANFKESGVKEFDNGDILFDKVNFKYPSSDSYIFENFNLNIKNGSKVAFVGSSGSGKTTITRLLMRSYNYEGKIFIGNNELKTVDAEEFRKSIGYVEQHVDLFDDTVKNNILLGVDNNIINQMEKDNTLDVKLEEIAKLSRIDEFYNRLGEKKFDTEIGERGVKLSGGERQRIGIARAIIKNPNILIFDEATSALDTVNEKYIKEAIDNVSKGRTTIIIAHRLSTVIDCDKIFVMEKGKVVASGKHDELLKSSIHYQKLVKHQK